MSFRCSPCRLAGILLAALFVPGLAAAAGSCGGNHGLTDDVPQAEGLAMDDRGSLYVVSEPNLFYRFSRALPAAD